MNIMSATRGRTKVAPEPPLASGAANQGKPTLRMPQLPSKKQVFGFLRNMLPKKQAPVTAEQQLARLEAQLTRAGGHTNRQLQVEVDKLDKLTKQFDAASQPLRRAGQRLAPGATDARPVKSQRARQATAAPGDQTRLTNAKQGLTQLIQALERSPRPNLAGVGRAARALVQGMNLPPGDEAKILKGISRELGEMFLAKHEIGVGTKSQDQLGRAAQDILIRVMYPRTK